METYNTAYVVSWRVKSKWGKIGSVEVLRATNIYFSLVTICAIDTAPREKALVQLAGEL